MLSTHDLELALRTPDVVWLMMPGGEMMTGAPEDVVLSGAIAQAFEGRQIRFQRRGRAAFRWLTGDRGDARTCLAAAPRAAMARGRSNARGYAVDESIRCAARAIGMSTMQAGTRQPRTANRSGA